MDNISGHGKYFEAPKEIKKWNWGAFWLTWIWGFFNETFISLLIFVPGINLLVPFYLGFKGNELSWQNKKWKNQEVFLKVQKKWAILGWIFLPIALCIIALFISNQHNLIKQEEYIRSESVQLISGNVDAVNLIGEDFEIIEYIRGSSFYFFKSTYSIVIESGKGKYWGTIRLDDSGKINEILVSHYYVINGFREVVITINE